MPAEYDPLRYGPSTTGESTTVPPRRTPAIPPAGEVLARREDGKTAFASPPRSRKHCRRGGRGDGGVGKSPRPVLVPVEVLAYDSLTDHVRLSLPEDVVAALLSSGGDRAKDRCDSHTHFHVTERMYFYMPDDIAHNPTVPHLHVLEPDTTLSGGLELFSV